MTFAEGIGWYGRPTSYNARKGEKGMSQPNQKDQQAQQEKTEAFRPSRTKQADASTVDNLTKDERNEAMEQARREKEAQGN